MFILSPNLIFSISKNDLVKATSSLLTTRGLSILSNIYRYNLESSKMKLSAFSWFLFIRLDNTFRLLKRKWGLSWFFNVATFDISSSSEFLSLSYLCLINKEPIETVKRNMTELNPKTILYFNYLPWFFFIEQGILKCGKGFIIRKRTLVLFLFFFESWIGV